MNNNKKPSPYDWFKGNNNSDGKKNVITLKFIWKIARIFIYLALFVFTMTGCVQSFVMKTDNKIGDGVEFYTSEKAISPHVTKFNLSIQKVKKDDSTNSLVDIYTLRVDPKKPVWVNSDKELKDVKEALKEQGVNNLSDAYRGGNETISIQGNATLNEKDPNWSDKHSIESLGAHVATWSTASKTGPSELRTSDSDVSSLGERYILINNNSYKIDFGFFDASKDSMLLKNSKMALMAINTILDKEVSPDGGQTSPKRLIDYLKTHLLQNPIEVDTNNKIDKASTYNPGSSIKQRESAQQILDIIFRYSGVKLVTPGPSVDHKTPLQISYTNQFVPGIGIAGTTSYRPMVTWGSAWKRGPFYGIFVYPIAKIATTMIKGMGDLNGWEMLFTIFIVVWVTRALTFLLSFKSIIQQTKMQELAGKKAVIDAKYAAYKGNKQMEMRKNQEVQELYKKEGVSMFGSIGSIFLTMPFFVAMWRVIGAIPHLKAVVWAGISFTATSWRELFTGEWQYLPLIIAAAFFAAGQQILPRLLTKKRDRSRINVQQKAAMKKNNKTQNIMLGIFVVMAVIFNAGLQIYWVAGGIWMMIQSVATHHYFVWNQKRKRRLKIKA